MLSNFIYTENLFVHIEFECERIDFQYIILIKLDNIIITNLIVLS